MSPSTIFIARPLIIKKISPNKSCQEKPADITVCLIEPETLGYWRSRLFPVKQAVDGMLIEQLHTGKELKRLPWDIWFKRQARTYDDYHAVFEA